MKRLHNLMLVTFADNKTKKIIELTNIPMAPYIGHDFNDIDKTYTVKDISIDLWNNKIFIYIETKS